MRKVVLGVFQVANSWKLYMEQEGARTFSDRSAAIAEGNRTAREAMAHGAEVHFHIQDVTGELRQADLARAAH